MIGDFDIRNNNWNLSNSHYLALSNIFLEVADFFDLKLSYSVNQVSTQYTNNPNNVNLVINLMFL